MDNFVEILKQNQGRQYDLHEQHINPIFVKMLRTIGFDRGYVRGEGCYLWDAEGNKYLDLLTGWGVFALGRNHPKIKSVLQQVLNQNMPNLVRMDCSLLARLAAEALPGPLPTNGADFFRNRFGDLMPGTRKITFNNLADLEAALKDKQAAAFIVD